MTAVTGCTTDCTAQAISTLLAIPIGLLFTIAVGVVATRRRDRRNRQRIRAGEAAPGDLAAVRNESLLALLEELRTSGFTGAVDVGRRKERRRLYLRAGHVVSATGPEPADEDVVVAAFDAARAGAALSVLAREQVPDGGRFSNSLAALEQRSRQ